MNLYRALYGGQAFEGAYLEMKQDILQQELIFTGEWQSQNEAQAAQTREMSITLEYKIPEEYTDLQDEVMPNLPWAEDHFQERVSGIPHNPPPSAGAWPFRRDGHKEHLHDGKFSHTYPERFWPGRIVPPPVGYRFPVGDLLDVVELLIRLPGTRQAYLPVWFPEDTGATAHQRVPCTLGYQFLYRDGQLNCFYFMRSCDLIRHFPDDVYLAGRLTQWIADRMRNAMLDDVRPGTLTMVVSAMHIFQADTVLLHRELGI